LKPSGCFLFVYSESAQRRKYFTGSTPKPNNAKDNSEGNIFLFHGDDSLAGHTYLFSQLLLGHFAMKETQLPDIIADPTFAHLRTPFGKDRAG
jgi:hypothetical protein